MLQASAGAFARPFHIWPRKALRRGRSAPLLTPFRSAFAPLSMPLRSGCASLSTTFLTLCASFLTPLRASLRSLRRCRLGFSVLRCHQQRRRRCQTQRGQSQKRKGLSTREHFHLSFFSHLGPPYVDCCKYGRAIIHCLVSAQQNRWGTARPSALAVLRFRTISNFTGNCGRLSADSAARHWRAHQKASASLAGRAGN